MKKVFALLLTLLLLAGPIPGVYAEENAGEAYRRLDAACAALAAAGDFAESYQITAVYSPEEAYDVSLVNGALVEYHGRLSYEDMFAGKISYAVICDMEGKILAIVTYSEHGPAWLSCSSYDAAAAMAAMRTASMIGGLIDDVSGEINDMMEEIS